MSCSCGEKKLLYGCIDYFLVIKTSFEFEWTHRLSPSSCACNQDYLERRSLNYQFDILNQIESIRYIILKLEILSQLSERSNMSWVGRFPDKDLWEVFIQ